MVKRPFMITAFHQGHDKLPHFGGEFVLPFARLVL